MIRLLCTCLLLFLVAFLVRLQGISTLDPHTDEQHWLSRSTKFLYKLEHEPMEATSHFGHPGLVPGIAMAGAQVLSKWVNNHLGDGDPIEPLIPSRIVMALVASLAVPLLFLLMHSSFGLVPAVFAALLLTLDPHHVGLSRLAHLDAALTTFILLATLLYVTGVQRNKRGMVLLAGLAWGCAIATKPTAAAFVPALLLYRLARWRLLPQRPAPLWWVDVWAIVLGHLVLVLLWTRLWFHKSELLVKLKVKSVVARFFHRSGLWLDEYHWMALGGTAVLWIAVLLCVLSCRRGKVSPSKCHGLAFVALAVTLLVFSPALLENSARYWSWAAGLSGIVHDGFGHRWASPDHGYITLLLASLPEAVLVGLVLGLTAFLIRTIRTRPTEQYCFLIFTMVLIVLWCVPLQISSKQGWRYALPVVPFLYLLCSFGFWSIAAGLRRSQQERSVTRHIPAVLFIVVVVLQGAALMRFEPYPLVYVNDLMGGIKGAIAHHISYPPVGLIKAAEVLDGEAKRRSKEIFVTVVGDESTMRLSSRLLPPPRGTVRYGFYPQESADYLLAPLQLRDPILGEGWNNVTQQTPIYRYSFHDLVVYEIFAVPPTPLEVPWRMALRNMGHQRGQVSEAGCVEVQEGRDKRGIVASYFGIEVSPMTLHARLDGVLIAPDSAMTLEFALNSDCKRFIAATDLPSTASPFSVEFSCPVDVSRRIRPLIFWSGKGALCLDSITLMRGE